jgi:hypothetical protein
MELPHLDPHATPAGHSDRSRWTMLRLAPLLQLQPDLHLSSVNLAAEKMNLIHQIVLTNNTFLGQKDLVRFPFSSQVKKLRHFSFFPFPPHEHTTRDDQ